MQPSPARACRAATRSGISKLNDAIDKVVVADSLSPEQTPSWTNTRIIKRAHALTQLSALKRDEGADILVFGSHTLWNGLLLDGSELVLHRYAPA